MAYTNRRSTTSLWQRAVRTSTCAPASWVTEAPTASVRSGGIRILIHRSAPSTTRAWSRSPRAAGMPGTAPACPKTAGPASARTPRFRLLSRSGPGPPPSGTRPHDRAAPGHRHLRASHRVVTILVAFVSSGHLLRYARCSGESQPPSRSSIPLRWPEQPGLRESIRGNEAAPCLENNVRNIIRLIEMKVCKENRIELGWGNACLVSGRFHRNEWSSSCR